MKRIKKILALCLAFLMLFGILPISPLVSAETLVRPTAAVKMEAENYATNVGGKILSDSTVASGGKYVGDFYVNSSLTFDIHVETAGEYTIVLREGSQQAGAAKILIGETEVGTQEFPATGGWQNYVDIAYPVTLEAGRQSLTVLNTKGTWNLDYILVLSEGCDLTSKEVKKIEAEAYIEESGTKVLSNNPKASGGKYVGDYSADDYLVYGVNVQDAGQYKLSMAVASPNSGNSAKVMVAGKEYEGSFVSTTDWQKYQILSMTIDLPAGVQAIKILNTGNTWNFDYFTLESYPYQDGFTVTKEGPTTIEAEWWADSSGIKNEASTASGGYNVGNTDDGDYFSYPLNVEERGLYRITMMVACGNGVGAPRGIRVGTAGMGTSSASVPVTEGWQSYVPVEALVRLEVGQQKLLFDVQYEGWNLDYFTLTYLEDLSNATQFGTVYASSSQEGFEAEKAVDLTYDNPENGWKAEGTVHETIGLRFEKPYIVRKVVLYDLIDAENQILSGTLYFSDGSTISVDTLPNDGAPKTVEFDEKSITWVDFVIDSVSDTTVSAGLTEFEVHGEPDAENTQSDIALSAYVRSAKGWLSMTKLLSGIPSKDNQLQLNWNTEKKIHTFILSGLPESLGDTLETSITLMDGSVIVATAPIETSSRIAVLTFDNPLHGDTFIFEFDLPKGETLSVGKVQAYGTDYTNQTPAYEKVQLINRWKGTEIFYEKDGKLCYAISSSSDLDKELSLWNLIPDASGRYAVQNVKTGNYLVLEGDVKTVSCLPNGNQTDAGKWEFKDQSGYKRIHNALYSKRALHVEGQDGTIYCEDVPTTYHSAMWTISVAERDYEILPNRIVDSGKRAIANDGYSITSNDSGSDKTWTLSQDMSGTPKFSAPNMPMVEAVYNLTLEEVLLSKNTGKYGDVFWTGVNWHKVWTRDTAMAVHYSLAWIFPQESENCALEKVVGQEGSYTFEQDTGTGGSYPVSVDKIITQIATWEQYLTTGNTEHLNYFYDITKNTIEQDYHVAFDAKSGLFKGETGGLDHRDKTYPDWMSETYEESLANIAESKSSIVNIIYTEVLDILRRSAEILGKDEAEIQRWATLHDELKAAVNEHFWLEDRGMYASWEYPDYMGSPVADKIDVISNGYALMFDIGTPEQQEQIMKNYPMVLYGAPTVFPQKNGRQGGTIYHNRGVWPGWEGTLMIGAHQKGNLQLADEIWKSCIRGAAMCLTNKEVIDFTTGAGLHSDRQLWSVASTLAGYYRVLFGMEYTEDGITFNPFIPEWLEGPFELSDYTYRNATLNIKLSGTGDVIQSFKLDGEEVGADYVLPTDISGAHTIEIVMTDSGNRSEINLNDYNHVTCPDLPIMTLNADGTLTWKEDSRYTYKLWNGQEFIPVSGGSYTPPADHYGVYSLVAVASDGITSEMSRPIVVNAAENVLIYEAEDGIYNEANFKSSTAGFTGRGYVSDTRSNPTEITIEVEIAKEGNYQFSAVYNNKGDSTSGNYCGIRSVYLDGEDYGTMHFPVMNFNYQESTHLAMYLTAGKHTITLKYDDANWYDRSMNITRNDVEYDSFKLEYVDDDSQTATVELPEVIYKNQTFQMTVHSPADYDAIKLVNENGRVVYTKIVEKTVNEDGSVTTVLSLSVGTAGTGRELQILLDGKTACKFVMDVLRYQTDIISVSDYPASVQAGKNFSVTVTTTNDLIKIRFMNEYGRGVGRTITSRAFVGDTLITTCDLVIETPGQRTLTAQADFDKCNDFPYSKNFEIEIQ